MHPKYARLVRRSKEPQNSKIQRKKLFFLKPKFLRRVLGIFILLVTVSWSFQYWIPSSKAFAAPWSSNHGSYGQRKQLTLVNNSGQTFESGTTYKVTIDTQSLVSSGSLLNTCDDLRIVYQPSDTTAVELKRNVEFASSSSGITTCGTSSATKVVFQLQSSIASAASDGGYYLYYDNAQATTYSSSDALDAYNVGVKEATFVAPFNGTTQALAAGSGTPTTATGAIRYSGGKSALSFSYDAVAVNHISSLMTATDLTVEFWVYVPVATDQNCYSAGTPIIQHTGNFQFSVCGNGSYVVWGVKSTNKYIVSVGNLIGQWHHIAMVRNSTANTNYLYIDGVQKDTDTYGIGAGGTHTIMIGRDESFATNRGFTMDELRVSESARYTSNFSVPTAPFVRDDNTKLLLHFDESGDDPRNTGKAIDDSGNGNHGTITGAKYVGGLVGVDGSTTSTSATGYQSSQSYAGHEGIFVEEGTTNKITNPSFDHTTYNTNWSATQTYTQEDQFTTARAGGAVNGTSAEPTGGTRTTIDTNSKISITGGQLSFATGEAANDGVWYPVQTRAAGKLLSATITPADTNGDILFGWDTDQTGAIADAIKFTASGVLQIVPNGGTAVTVGSYTATAYQVASVMRATGIYWFIKGGTYTTWTQLFSTSAGSANMYPAIQAGNTTAVFTIDNMRIPTATWLPTPLAYDTFTRANGALGSTEATGPDSQVIPQIAWTGSTWTVSGNTAINTPNLGTEAEPDPGLEGTYTSGLSASLYQQFASVVAQSSDTHGGSKAQQYYGLGVNYSLFQDSSRVTLTNGGWYRGSLWGKRIVNNGSGVNPLMFTTGFMPSGQVSYSVSSSSYAQYSRSVRVTNSSGIKLDWLISAGNPSDEVIIDDLSMRPLTLPELFSSVTTSKSDVVASVNTTRHAVNTGELSGLVVKLDSTSNPQNFLLAYTYSGVNVSWHMTVLEKCVNGTYTTLIYSNAVGYSAGAPLRVVTNGSSVSLYYNNIQVGTTQTVSDASIVNNTLHGTFSTYEGNTLDNFTLFPLGNGGENASIPVEPTEFLTATENSTAPYFKFGSKSVKLVDATNATQYATSINPGNTNTHTLSAYVYDGTTGNIGGTVSSSIAKLVFNGATVTPAVYTDVGGGWWRLTYSAAAANATATYGVEVQAGKTIYVDGVQLEEKAYATTYTDGTEGTGYAWTGTAHESTSTRSASNIDYSASSNISNTQGSISFWIKTNYSNDGLDHIFFEVNPDPGCGYLRILKNSSNYLAMNDGCSNGSSIAVSWTAGSWVHVVGVWATNYLNLYYNGVAGTPSSTFNQRTITNIAIGKSIGNSFYSDSQISDFRIFGSQLTATEITDLYNAGIGSQTSLAPVATERYTDGEPPVLAWHLNEGYGTTAYDTTIYQNSGTVSGATWSDDSGQAGMTGSKSLKFDGSNDYVSRAYSNDIELAPGTSPFSVSTWFKHPSTVTGTDTLISRYSSTGSGGGYKVYMNSSGFICFGVDDDTTWGPDDSACTTVSYADSNWHHVLAIKGTSTIAVYIDGTQKASTAFTVSSSLSGSSPTFYTGIDSDGTSNPWDGFIDEVRVYNSVRSEEQINQEYIAKGTNKGVSVILGSGATPESLSNGLVGHWKMDEASWNGTAGEVLDASGNGNNGVRSGDATTAVGKYGNGGSFDGSNDYVSTNFDVQPSAVPITTWAVWVKPTSSSGKRMIITDDDGGYDRGIESSRDGDGNFNIFTGSSSWAPINADLNQWQHIAVVWTFDNIYFYKNGVKYTYGAAPVGQSTVNKLRIGGHSNGIEYFSGSIDDVRIYNRALSPVEVRALYEYAPGPVAHYTFDEGSGQSAYDKSGNGNTGTLGASSAVGSDDPTWTNGKYGKALSFDGGDDYVDAGGSSSLLSLNQGTFSSWVKFNSNSAISAIGGVGNNGNCTSSQWGIQYRGDHEKQIQIYSYPTDGSAANLDARTASNIITDKNWHHISVSVDNTNIRLYLDGTLQNLTGTVSNKFFGNAVTANKVTVGRHYTSACTNYINGSIDDVRIYNYARTQKQIIQDMNAGHPAVGSPVGSAVAHYKFDEGQGTVARNYGSAGSTLNGTLTNMSSPATSTSGWTNDGKFSKALNFDGNDDYVALTNSKQITQPSFTVSTWVKRTGGSGEKIIGGQQYCGGMQFALSQTNSLISFRVPNVAGNCDASLASLSIVSLNTWNHILGVFDGSKTYLYLNGKLVSTGTTFTGTFNTNPSEPFVIGRQDCSVGCRYFGGAIDEAKIYSYALSEDEVKLEYNQGKAIVMGSLGTTTDGKTADNSARRAYCPPGNVEGNCAAGQNPAPLAEWNFDEGSGTSAFDTSGYNKTGTLTNGPTWTSGKVGKALSFDGSDDYVSNGSQTSDILTGLSNFTINGWVKVNDTSTGKNIYHESDQNSGSWIELNVNSDEKAGFSIYTNSYQRITSTVSLSPSTWHYITATFSTVSGMKLYIDGVQDGFNSNTSNPSRATGSTIGAAYIYMGGGSLGGFMSGLIDSVRLFNYARTPAQIAWDYNKGAPIAHYKFDECTGTLASNLAPASQGDSGNDATITIGASGTQTSAGNCSSGVATEAWNNGTTGKFNNAMSFDGTDDYVQTGDLTYNIYGTAPFSQSVWVKTSTKPSAGTYKSITQITETGQGSITHDKGFVVTSTGAPAFYTFPGAQNYTIGTTDIANNVWHHLTASYDGTNVRLYVDGKLEKTQAVASTYQFTSPQLVLSLNNGWFNYYTGLMDDFRLYNYALTDAQVKLLYNNASAVNFK